MKRVMVTVGDETLSLSDWAKKIGISRQRVHQLYCEERLIPYILGEIDNKPGHPVTKDKTLMVMLDVLKTPRSIDELSEIMSLSKRSCFRYINELKSQGLIIKESGKWRCGQ